MRRILRRGLIVLDVFFWKFIFIEDELKEEENKGRKIS